MALLSVNEYNAIESNAIKGLPNRIIGAFQPVAFNLLGYPAHVKGEKELYKFIDVMHEGEYLSNRMKTELLLTSDEFGQFP